MSTMDKSKIPFLQEDAIRIQRVEIYMFDLKQRLRQLRLKHEAVIKDSVELFEELDDVSTSLLPGKQSRRKETRKSQNIRNLIQEFERSEKLSCSSEAMAINNTPANAKAAQNMHGILKKIERLNTSHILQESLDLFQNAKDFYEKVDNLVGTVSNYKMNKVTEKNKVSKSSDEEESKRCPSLRDKIVMFDNMSKHLQSSSYKLGSYETKQSTIKCNNNDNKNSSEDKGSNCDLPMINSDDQTLQHTISNNIKESESSEHSDEEVQYSIHYDSVPKDEICFMAEHDITELSDVDEHLLINNGPSGSTSFQSIETYHTANEYMSVSEGAEIRPFFSNEKGYEGDCDDSEFNLYALKKRTKPKH